MPSGRPSESESLSQIACFRCGSSFFLAGVRTLTPGTRFPFAGENMCVRISGAGAMGEESGSSGCIYLDLAADLPVWRWRVVCGVAPTLYRGNLDCVCGVACNL